MFAESTEWKIPWLPGVLPNIVAIAAAHAERTLFTRFIPAKTPGEASGMWRRYYERWSSMKLERLGPEMIDLVPDLALFVSPARTFEKASLLAVDRDRPAHATSLRRCRHSHHLGRRDRCLRARDRAGRDGL